MAMILRSSIGKVVRRAVPSEGTLSVRLSQPLRRQTHAGRAADSAPNPLPRTTEVEQLVKKVEDVAKKEVLLECAESLVEKQKRAYRSPVSLRPCLLGLGSVCLFMAGYHLGLVIKQGEAGPKQSS